MNTIYTHSTIKHYNGGSDQRPKTTPLYGIWRSGLNYIEIRLRWDLRYQKLIYLNHKLTFGRIIMQTASTTLGFKSCITGLYIMTCPHACRSDLK